MKDLLRSFAGGEITPELFGRVDLAKFQTGLAKVLNFWVLPHGPVQNRPGFAYINEVKDSTKKVRLIPFSYSTTQTFILEFGPSYIRFHTNGGTLLEAAKNITGITQPAGVITSAAHGFTNGQWVYLASIGGMTQLNGRFAVVSDAAANTFRIKDFAGNYITTGTYGAYTAGGTASRVYEIATTYAEADLFDLHYTQSADVLTIVHPNYAPRELKRLGATNWTIADISFVPTISSPSLPLAAPLPASGTDRTRYKVTSIAQDGLEESIPDSPAYVSTGAITGATQANPGVITVVAHGRAVGDAVYIAGVGGMTQLNGNEYLVNTVPTANTLTLKTMNGVAVDTTAYGVYTAGGTLYITDVVNSLGTAGNLNTITWTAVATAVRYNVYKLRNGLYGYVGQTAVNSFVDDNITPDLGKTPPERNTPFSGAGEYPGAVGYFEQRRVFAGSNNKPQNYWMTRSATESNLSYSIPTRDDDAIAGRIVSSQVNRIRHVVPISVLLLLTSGGEWKVAPQNSDILTPDSAAPKAEITEGCSNVTPVITGRAVLYAQDSGGHVREMKYTRDNYGNVIYDSADTSLLAPHLFDTYTIADLAFTKVPHKMLWAVRSDGVLLGLTYLPEQEVIAWHQHNTDGTFESVAAVKETDEYPVYAVVKRSINGRNVRYIERLHKRFLSSQNDAFHVDSGLTYSGAAATSISGLWHLEGETVSVLADGNVHPQLTVTNGTITLAQSASTVHIGLRITADLQTLPLALEAMQALGQGTEKNVNEVWLRVRESKGIKAGPTFSRLREYKQRTNEAYDESTRLVSDEVHLVVDNSWNRNGSVCIRQQDPLPITVVAMTLGVAVGG